MIVESKLIDKILKRERSEVFILHALQGFLFIVTKLYLAFLTSDLLNLSTLGFFICVGVFENFHYKALRDLNYTYWTLTILKFLWILSSLLGSGYFFNDFTFAMFTITILLCLGVEAYLMSSPIYYPRVQWWEYDFRYRGDLKMKIEVDGVEYRARLADLRREAGCVISFTEIPMGESFVIKSYLEDETIRFLVRVVSNREDIQGRGYRYGVQFLLSNKEEAKLFKKYQSHYLRRYKVKRRSKFA